MTTSSRLLTRFTRIFVEIKRKMRTGGSKILHYGFSVCISYPQFNVNQLNRANAWEILTVLFDVVRFFNKKSIHMQRRAFKMIPHQLTLAASKRNSVSSSLFTQTASSSSLFENQRTIGERKKTNRQKLKKRIKDAKAATNE